MRSISIIAMCAWTGICGMRKLRRWRGWLHVAWTGAVFLNNMSCGNGLKCNGDEWLDWFNILHSTWSLIAFETSAHQCQEGRLGQAGLLMNSFFQKDCALCCCRCWRRNSWWPWFCKHSHTMSLAHWISVSQVHAFVKALLDAAY